MTKFIAIDGNTTATTAVNLGDLISSGELRQIGVIRTEYVVDKDGQHFVRGRSMEAVVVNDAGEYLAVEQHRGLAIMVIIADEEMKTAFREADEAGLEEGEVLVYDQRIMEGTEMIAEVKGLDMSHIPVEDGTDGIA